MRSISFDGANVAGWGPFSHLAACSRAVSSLGAVGRGKTSGFGGLQAAGSIGNFRLDRNGVCERTAGSGDGGAFAVMAAAPGDLFDKVRHVGADRHEMPPGHQPVIVPLPEPCGDCSFSTQQPSRSRTKKFDHAFEWPSISSANLYRPQRPCAILLPSRR